MWVEVAVYFSLFDVSSLIDLLSALNSLETEELEQQSQK